MIIEHGRNGEKWGHKFVLLNLIEFNERLFLNIAGIFNSHRNRMKNIVFVKWIELR